MKGKGRSRQAILAAVTVLAAAQAGTGIGVRSTDRRLDSGRTGLEISGNGRNA
jgi:hypothetical protein